MTRPTDAERRRPGGAMAGIDVGGTFTDVACVDGEGWRFGKVLTTPEDPSAGMLEALARVTGEGGAPAIGAMMHGTTLVTNAVIERKGARVGLITTAGFRDILGIGREPRYDTFDLFLDKPAPLVPRDLCLEVGERLRYDGTVARSLDPAEVRAAARELREAGVEAVAVCLIHAFRNPAHEEAIAAILVEELPGCDVSLSSRVCPEIGEYVRTSTTVANAYVRPRVRGYLGALGRELEARGFRGTLYLMQSNGAIVTPDVAMEAPIQLIESGPAAGAIAAARQGVAGGFPDLIAFDMGGTTAKICLVDGGAPARAAEFEAARLHRFKRGSGLPLRVPVIEMIEIGAGGGSLAAVDARGLLCVGPESAGAAPGPACYDRGGDRPTVTDADLVLGYLDPGNFLGGDMALVPALAEAALQTHVGEPFKTDVVTAARGVFDLVNSHMATAMRIHAVERNRNLRSYILFAFGGAGPVHAYPVARSLGIREVVVPPGAGVGSAIGLLAAPLAVDVPQSRVVRLDRLTADDAARIVGDLTETATRRLLRMGAAPETIRLARSVEMRYVGQGYQVSVPIDGSAAGGVLDAERLRAAFERTYHAAYGLVLEGRRIETLTWRVMAEAPRPGAAPDSLRVGPVTRCGEPRKGTRPAFFPEAGGFIACAVYDRYALEPGFEAAGPAVIEEREATTVVGPVDRLHGVLPMSAFNVGMIKAPVFAAFIAIIACRMGLLVARDARSVGINTTSTVVQSIVWVILLDAIFAVVFERLDI